MPIPKFLDILCMCFCCWWVLITQLGLIAIHLFNYLFNYVTICFKLLEHLEAFFFVASLVHGSINNLFSVSERDNSVLPPCFIYLFLFSVNRTGLP